MVRNKGSYGRKQSSVGSRGVVGENRIWGTIGIVGENREWWETREIVGENRESWETTNCGKGQNCGRD